MNTIATFTNPEDGIEVRVNERRDGRFSVVVRDTDAQMDLDVMLVYASQDAALAAADRIVHGQDPSPGRPAYVRIA